MKETKKKITRRILQLKKEAERTRALYEKSEERVHGVQLNCVLARINELSRFALSMGINIDDEKRFLATIMVDGQIEETFDNDIYEDAKHQAFLWVMGQPCEIEAEIVIIDQKKEALLDKFIIDRTI